MRYLALLEGGEEGGSQPLAAIWRCDTHAMLPLMTEKEVLNKGFSFCLSRILSHTKPIPSHHVVFFSLLYKILPFDHAL